MGRPPLGPAKRSRTIAIHVTQSQHELIEQQGKPAIWARRAVLDALTEAIAPRIKTRTKPVQEIQLPPAPEPSTVSPGDETAHRHKRERTGEKWVGGRDVGTWKCADPACGVTLGPLQ